MARTERRTEVTDGAVLAAMAHPLRVALLYQLNALGSRTASQCAQALGETPANCSYHLRQLAKVGLVARDEAGNGRERPWRPVYTGLDLHPAVDDPDPEVVTAARATRAALANAEIEEHARLARQYLRLERRAPKALARRRRPCPATPCASPPTSWPAWSRPLTRPSGPTSG